MKCDKIKQNILDGSSDAETLEHLRECPDCTSFKDFSAFIGQSFPVNGDFSPPEKIGLAVRSMAIEHVRNKNASEKPEKIKFLYYVSALAAAFAIVTGTLLFIPKMNTISAPKIVKDSGKQTVATPPWPRSSLKWDDVDLTDEIEGVTEDIEISTALIYSTDPDEEPTDSEDTFTIDINEFST